MWKKLLIGIVAFTVALTAGSAFYNKGINANEKDYSSGGKVYGRIGDVQTHDRFYIFTNSYPLHTVSNDGTMGIVTLFDEAIGSITWTNTYGDADVGNSNYRYFITDLNATIDERDKNIIEVFHKPPVGFAENQGNYIDKIPDEWPYFIGLIYYYMRFATIGSAYSQIVATGPTFSEFFINGTWYGGTYYDDYSPGIIAGNSIGIDMNFSSKRAVQPGVLIKKNIISFALSLPTGMDGFAEVDTGNTSDRGRMKLRIKNDAIKASISDIVNKDGESIKEVLADEQIIIKGTATQGSDIEGNPYTVSLMVFDESGNFVYYKPLEAAKGTGDYTADLTGLPSGKYQFAIVNEAYNESSVVPADSSDISEKFSITIKEKGEDLRFYENAASNTVIKEKSVSITDKNVSVFATVKGSTNTNPVKYKIKDGSSDVIAINTNTGAIAVKGIGTVTIIATKEGNENQEDASCELIFTVTAGKQNFIYTDETLSKELPKTGDAYDTYSTGYEKDKTFQLYTSGYPQDSDITYKLKDGSPIDVISVGSNGTVHILNASKPQDIGKVIVQATSHVASGMYEDKTIELPITITKAKPTIKFNDTNQTKKSISDAGTAWNETATATPSTGTKVTYSVSGGDIGLIDIDANTGAITYQGSNAFGKVKIKAIADDDPTSGNDNYEAVDTEKEIVIYREVNGNVTPDNNSSDSMIPTFKASDANVKTNGVIGTIKGTLGTPDTIGGSITTYTYGLKAGVGDANFFSVDPSSGVIKATANLGVKTYSITVTVSDKWSTKEIPVSINVGVANAEDLKFYENSTSNTVITTQSAKITDTNVFVYATVKGSSNTNPVTYKVKDGSATVLEVNPNSGKITPKGVGSATIVAEKAGDSGQAAAAAELTFTITAGDQAFIFTDATLSNELSKTDDKYDAKEEVYEKGKTFQLYTAGYPIGATVTYQLKAGSPTDVISVDSNGLVHILNADLNNQMGKVVVEATSHDPSGSYSDKTIELPINITKADQTISFADITYAVNGKGKVTPIINEQDISSNDGGVQINDTDYYITIDSSINTAVAWTNNGIDIEYDFNGKDGLDIPLHVEKAGNRNYNKAEADGSMRIMGPDESTLAINRPGKIIYGDHFEIKSLQDDSGSTNVQYQFEVDNTTYISNPTINGHKAAFDALRFSGKTNINIKVTRTADGETPLSKIISVQVLPKEIEITIDDKDKYKGEANPTLTYQDFKSQLVSWNGVQDVIQEHDIKLSTTAQTNSQAENYPIKGDANSLNNIYPNYSFKFVEGTLTIKEDNIEDDWYHMELADGSHTPYSGDWTDQDVTIISDHTEYVNLSLDQSTWSPQKIMVSKEGETNQSFWMKKNSGAITKEKQEIIRIDKTPPKVKGIKAKDSNNQLQDIIQKLSGGIFFQPGTAFEITTSDENSTLKVSETKEISYKIYKIESTARSGEEEISSGTLSVTNEKASITISETTGTYRVCVIPTDHAGNSGEESCHEVTLKKIDVDVDDDGKPDFNDPDGDGCPDLNIKWKDPSDSNKWIVINGDRDNDGIPDLNIDSDGDGKPDLNIDTDHDGKPDLNLVLLKNTDWKPTKCVKKDITKSILEEYCTGTTVKPMINVDLDKDFIPDININTKGEMKADINVTKPGETKPYINLVPINVWKPNKDYTYQKFVYDTMTIEPLLNIDTDGDGLPDINLDLDGDGKADINIDVDGDFIPDTNIDSTGDGEPDINIDIDGDGTPDENIIELTEWKPTKNVDGDLPYDTMDLSVPQKPGDPDDPTAPSDPTKPSQQGNDSDTSVQGNYNPQESMGGANTGDTTNLILYMEISLLSLGMIFTIRYRRSTK